MGDRPGRALRPLLRCLQHLPRPADDAAWRRRLARRFKRGVEELCCNGCRALTASCWGNRCEIIKCLGEKALIHATLPGALRSCEKFGQLAAGYLDEGWI